MSREETVDHRLSVIHHTASASALFIAQPQALEDGAPSSEHIFSDQFSQEESRSGKLREAALWQKASQPASLIDWRSPEAWAGWAEHG